MTVKHRMSGSPEWLAWKNMRNRCNSETHQAYANYGGRGISVHPAWNAKSDGFEAFFEHVGPRPGDEYQLDRIDNEGNYEPGNVRWTTCGENQRNRRNIHRLTIDGDTRTVSEWSRLSGTGNVLIAYRLKSGHSAKDAVWMPPGSLNVRGSKERGRSRANNVKLTINDRTMCISAWAEVSGARADTVWRRLDRGWNAKDAVYGRSAA